jgi:putative DNA primase/helicase
MIEPSTSHHTYHARPPSKYRLLGQRELLEQPRMAWLVQGVLPKAGIAAIYGDTKSGKSFLAIDLLLAVAEGREWFGYRTEAVPATYLALEAQAGVSQRVLASSVRRGEPSERFKVITQDFSLVNPEDLDELAACLVQSERRGGVLIIDTLARAAAGLDENAPKDMGQIIQGASKLQSLMGGLVVLVHHTGKDGSKGPRGHSSFMAALDAAIRVERKASRRTWKVEKAKDAEDGKAHSFELEVVSLGVDAQDNPASSCVIVSTGEASQDSKGAKLPQGANQTVVWQLLQEGWANSWDTGQGGAQRSTPRLHLTQLIDMAQGKLSAPPDRVGERVKDALKGLVGKGLVHQEDLWLWPVPTPEKT